MISLTYSHMELFSAQAFLVSCVCLNVLQNENARYSLDTWGKSELRAIHINFSEITDLSPKYQKIKEPLLFSQSL